MLTSSRAQRPGRRQDRNKMLVVAAIAAGGIALAIAAPASAREFRSPDGKIYCYFSTSEPVAACMTGNGSKYRVVLNDGADIAKYYWSFSWDSSHYGKSRTPRRGPKLRSGQTVRYLSTPERTDMRLACQAPGPRQMTCWDTDAGLVSDGPSAGLPKEGFTMFSGCGTVDAAYGPPTLQRVTPCSAVPGDALTRFGSAP